VRSEMGETLRITRVSVAESALLQSRPRRSYELVFKKAMWIIHILSYSYYTSVKVLLFLQMQFMYSYYSLWKWSLSPGQHREGIGLGDGRCHTVVGALTASSPLCESRGYSAANNVAPVP
jgi:hypothetical protein